MAKTRRMAPDPTLAQVRDYVLTMLEGLSSLAETVDDLHTRDQVRDFSHRLITSWSAAPAAALLDAGGETRRGAEAPSDTAADVGLILRKRP